MTNFRRSYNLSFAGCGFLGLYHAGVCGCIQNCAPQLYKNRTIAGTSAGAIAATFLICEVNLSECVQYLNDVINESRQYFLGPFDPRFKITQLLMEGLDLHLPDNAHEICTGRLHISMTNFKTWENVVVSEFYSKKDLIKAIACSSFIPVFSGYVPFTFRGMPMIDGAMSKNMLELNEDTIKVSPFSGGAHICPKDDMELGRFEISGMQLMINLENLGRSVNIMWPKSSEDLGNLVQQGYSDTLHFLRLKGFIKCDLHQCRTLFMKLDVDLSNKINRDDCIKCRKRLKESLNSYVSQNILKCFTPQTSFWSSKFQILGNIYGIFKQLTNVATQPLFISINLIHQLVRILEKVPYLADQLTRLIQLDTLLQDAIGESLEFGQSHEALHQVLHRLPVIEFHDDFKVDNLSTSMETTSRSDINTDGESENESEHNPTIYVSIDNKEERFKLPYCLQDQNVHIRNLEVLHVSENDCIESSTALNTSDGMSDLNVGQSEGPHSCTMDSQSEDNSYYERQLPANRKRSLSRDELGEADGQSDGNSEENLKKFSKSLNSICDDKTKIINNGMTWSYPDSEHPDHMKYYVVGSIFTDSHASSTDKVNNWNVD